MPLSERTKTWLKENRRPMSMKARRAKIEKDSTCTHCKTVFESASQGREHTFWCANNHQCPHCPNDSRRYPEPMPLYRHYRKAHQPFPCSLCDVTIIDGQRDAHMAEYHPAEGLPDPPLHHERVPEERNCPWCTEAYTQATYLDHINAHLRSGNSRYGKPEPRADPRARQTPKEDAEPKPKVPEIRLPDRQPNHYETLGVKYGASQDEIAIAARAMRIKVHPDRLKRAGGLTPADLDAIDERAKRVGWAADVLCCENSRKKYDRRRQ